VQFIIVNNWTLLKTKDVDVEIERDLKEIVYRLQNFSGFDIAAFKQLIEDTGELVALKILARFYLTTEETITNVKMGIENDDSDIIWKACHKLCGSAELLGFKSYGQKSRKLNLDVKAMPDVPLHMNELTSYISEGREIMKAILLSFPNLKNYL